VLFREYKIKWYPFPKPEQMCACCIAMYIIKYEYGEICKYLDSRTLIGYLLPFYL